MLNLWTMIDFPELTLILVVVVLIFGAGRLPALGDALGRTVQGFRRAARGQNEIDVTPRREASKDL